MNPMSNDPVHVQLNKLAKELHAMNTSFVALLARTELISAQLTLISDSLDPQMLLDNTYPNTHDYRDNPQASCRP